MITYTKVLNGFKINLIEIDLLCLILYFVILGKRKEKSKKDGNWLEFG